MPPHTEVEGTAIFPTFERIGPDPRRYKVGFMDKAGGRVVAPSLTAHDHFAAGWRQ